MGVFNDVSQFLENRIDEFLKNNPHLELQALEEKLREQEVETQRLIVDLQTRQQQVERQILEIAQEVKRWHDRIAKARAANRPDLAEPAQVQEANLIRQGNQLWGHMEVLTDRLQQTQTVQQKINQQRQEVQAKVVQAKAARAAAQAAASPSSSQAAYNPWAGSWSAASPPPPPMDPLEEKFAQWEANEEIDRMKRQMGR
jgi:uncharacterized protein (TIGR04376 family)